MLEYRFDENTGRYRLSGFIDVSPFCTVTPEEKEILDKAETLLEELEGRFE